ncbi:hypothetical protein KR222_009646, partial [Zaprionus bogoriensis]
YQQMLLRPDLTNTTVQEEYITNSLNGFSLLRRLHQDWPKLLQYLEGSTTQTAIADMQHLLSEKATKEENFQAAIEGLLRIESVYNLEASHMAKGLLLNIQYKSGLNSADCFALGTHLFNKGKYSRSNHWFRTALRLYEQPYDRLYSKVLLMKHNMLQRSYALAIGKSTKTLRKRPKNAKEAKWQKEAENMMNEAVNRAKKADIKRLVNEYLAGDEEIFISQRAKFQKKPKALERGCRGLWPERKTHRLTCHYIQGHSVFQRLAPLKMETLNVQPDILLFHNVLSEDEIKYLKSTANDQGVPQDVLGIVKHFALPVSQNPIYVRLKSKVTDMMRLNVTNQSFHLYNFGLGGYLPSQLAVMRDNLKDQSANNRIATITFYASDVQLGGATIFPKLQLAVQPKQGNAIIWFHGDKGQQRKTVEHAICPVVVGSR